MEYNQHFVRSSSREVNEFIPSRFSSIENQPSEMDNNLYIRFGICCRFFILKSKYCEFNIMEWNSDRADWYGMVDGEGHGTDVEHNGEKGIMNIIGN